jgi:voltage-gated potassium channel Kch
MITFFYDMIKLLVGIWHGVKYDDEFRILLFFLVTLLTGATFFYYHVEGWGVIDSLYFSVMTMSTIGYGDFVPTTTLSKSFTIIFALLSIGVFVALMSKIVGIILRLKKLRRGKRKAGASSDDNQQS